MHCRALLLLLLVLLSTPAGAAVARPAGIFDYYVLALSWSPTFCSSEQERREPAQCAPGRRYAFIVHGLWPQDERGWPQYCAGSEALLPDDRIAGMLDIMPSRRLVMHQWAKHGTCSGLTPQDYFARTRSLFAMIRIPARYIAPQSAVETTPGQLVADFVGSNRGLEPAMVSVHCGNRTDRARLSELRICFSRDGVFQPCGDNARRQCRAERLVLPPVR